MFGEAVSKNVFIWIPSWSTKLQPSVAATQSAAGIKDLQINSFFDKRRQWISSDCEGWTIGNYLSRRSSSRVQHGCKCGHPFIFVFLCFLVVCIFAIIVQVAGGSAATAFLKSNILGKHCYKMKHLEKMHYSLPTFCYKFKCTLAWKKYTNAGCDGCH